MAWKYVVRLNSQEREQLIALLRKKNVAAYKRTNAQILLKADVSEKGPDWKDKRIADAFDVTVKTVERVRKRLCTIGLEAAISRAKGGGRKQKMDGREQAHLIALTCSEPPDGRNKWTLRLLADKFIELEHIDIESISHETIRQTLKKTKQNPGKEESGASHL